MTSQQSSRSLIKELVRENSDEIRKLNVRCDELQDKIKELEGYIHWRKLQ